MLMGGKKKRVRGAHFDLEAQDDIFVAEPVKDVNDV